MLLSSGTWTPAMWDATLSSSESQTYTTQYGAWTRIGNRVFIHGTLELLSYGSLAVSEYTRIGDLPFTASSTTNSGGSLVALDGSSLNIAQANMISGTIAPGNNHADIYQWTGNALPDWLQITEFSANGSLTFMAQYITDD